MDENQKLALRKQIFGKRYGALLGSGADRFGNYKKSYGGGTPLPKGEKAPSEEWVKDNRQMQPRDDDGKFTYNAVNGIELKYGPSRGTTENPLLRGAKLKMIKEGQKLKFEDGKVLTAVGGYDFSRNFNEYSETFGFGEDLDESLFMKKEGRPSKAEKEAPEGYIGEVDLRKMGTTQKQKLLDRFSNTTRNFVPTAKRAETSRLVSPEATILSKLEKDGLTKHFIYESNKQLGNALKEEKRNASQEENKLGYEQALKYFGR